MSSYALLMPARLICFNDTQRHWGWTERPEKECVCISAFETYHQPCRKAAVGPDPPGLAACQCARFYIRRGMFILKTSS